jgi:hypothetical protein
MDLIPDRLVELLLANGAEITENDDHIPLVKLIDPNTGETWFLSELSPEEPDCAFGLFHLKSDQPRLGYFALPHIRHAETPPCLAICRDETFTADLPLSVYARAARDAGKIVTDLASLAAAAEELSKESAKLDR